MSTIASTNIKHPSSATNNITLASTGAVAVNGSMTGAGLDLITPTSIAYSGGSASVSGGQITFSGVSSISINGCFSNLYQSYKIIHRITHSGTANVTMRLRASGTDASTSVYYYNGYYAQSTTGGAWNQNAVSGWTFSLGGSYTNRFSETTLFDVANAAITTGNLIENEWNGSAVGSVTVGLWHNNAISYDGFSFIADANSMTGSIRVYGYKNS